jgi:hypothetical protein
MGWIPNGIKPPYFYETGLPAAPVQVDRESPDQDALRPDYAFITTVRENHFSGQERGIAGADFC